MSKPQSPIKHLNCLVVAFLTLVFLRPLVLSWSEVSR